MTKEKPEQQNPNEMKAVILFNSKTGITKKYAVEIGEHLQKNGMEVIVSTVSDYSSEMIKEADYLLLGSWTRGLGFFLQRPGREWIDFARILPEELDPWILLFATYKIRTGSMFKAMYSYLTGSYRFSFVELKSRNGSLSMEDRAVLDKLTDQAA